MYNRGFWRPVNTPEKGIFHIIDEDIQKMLEENPYSMPDLRNSSTILVASDYSGEHSGTKYEVLSFLFVDIERCWQWEKERTVLRSTFLRNGRRMSFKDLNDKQRKRALKPFLLAADKIPGLSFTVAIESSIESLFAGRAPLDLSNPDFEMFRDWSGHTLEKAFRIVHFISFLLAGLSRPGQDLLWFTDEDSIAANPERVKQLTNLFAWISTGYLSFSLGHLRCGTTKCDDGSRKIEDFASVPDLIAGALSEQLELIRRKGPDMSSSVFWIYRGDYSDKVAFITRWLIDKSQSLKRLFCIIDSSANSSKSRVSWFHFHDRE